MYYRCTDTSLSLEDWFNLNTNGISGSLVSFVQSKEDDYHVEQLFLGEGNRCAVCDEHEDDCYCCCEECGEYRSDCECEGGFVGQTEAEAPETPEGHLTLPTEKTHWRTACDFPPMWDLMWEPESCTDSVQQALLMAGFDVYSVPVMEEYRVGTLIGVNGAGYDFYSNHIGPLRVALAYEMCVEYDYQSARSFPKDSFRRDRFLEILRSTMEECRRRGNPELVFSKFPYIKRACDILYTPEELALP